MTEDVPAVALAAFLAARLDEDEAAAKDAQRYLSECAGVRISDPADGANIAHMVAYAGLAHRHDPARVLREVEAKRAILRRCGRQAEEHDENPNALTEDRTWTIWPVLFDLAAVYRDHPDYQPKWAPRDEEE